MDVRKITYKDMPIGLDGLIDWLEGQDPETEYDWCSSRRCAIAQYAQAMGTTYGAICRTVLPRPAHWLLDDLPYDLDLLANNYGAGHTLGDLLSRAKALRDAQ